MDVALKPSVVDLDRKPTWPQEVYLQITPHLPEIAAERAAQNAFDMSGDRWFKPSPPSPRTDNALQIINAAMAGRQLRVFHATRLLEANSVLAQGLRPLNLVNQMAAVRSELVHRQLHKEVRELDEALREANLASQSYACREQQVWFTPLRRSLHDGGCDIFFEHWGGEAVQRLTQSKAQLTSAIQNLGSPAVVVGNIPAFGACVRSALHLAPAMLSLLLEDAGYDFCVESWDVMLKQAVPADWIEAVLSPDDQFLAA